MTERPVDLGSQKLLVSRELGTDFITALEGTPVGDEPEAVGLTRKYLAQHSGVNLIGTQIH